MKLSALVLAVVAGHASAQCIPTEYLQYRDKAAGPDGVRALAADFCMLQIGFRGALDADNDKATRRNPAYMKNSDACIAEMRKITDAAKAAGIAKEVDDMSKAMCPGR